MEIRSNRDLYACLTALKVLRDLESYLRALLGLGQEFAAYHPGREPTPAEAATLFMTAAAAPAIELDPAWRGRPPPWEEPRPRGLARFEAILIHQILDLQAMRSRGLTLLHGETFRILEPKTARSERIAKLMVQVCDEAVEVTKTASGGTSAHVSLAPDVVIANPQDTANLPLVNLFELTFAGPLTAAHMQGLSLASLHGPDRAAAVRTTTRFDRGSQ